jgi:Myb-like DNA-binding domain
VAKRGRWAASEDTALTQVMTATPFSNWPTVALSMGGRSAKQCRERWFCHLSPHVNKLPFSPAEDAEIMRLHALVGNKFSLIAATLRGRSENSVKSRIRTLLRTASEQHQRRHSAPAGSLRALVHESLGAVPTPTAAHQLAPSHTVPTAAFEWPLAPDPVPLWEQPDSYSSSSSSSCEAAHGLAGSALATQYQQEFDPSSMHAQQWNGLPAAPDVDLGAFQRECCVDELVQCLLLDSEHD